MFLSIRVVKRTFSPGEITCQLGFFVAVEVAGSAVDTTLRYAAAAIHLTDLAFVALDEVKVPAGHELGNGSTADAGGCGANGVVHYGVAAHVVCFQGFQVVGDALAREGAHVDDQGTVELAEIDGFISVR